MARCASTPASERSGVRVSRSGPHYAVVVPFYRPPAPMVVSAYHRSSSPVSPWVPLPASTDHNWGLFRASRAHRRIESALPPSASLAWGKLSQRRLCQARTVRLCHSCDLPGLELRTQPRRYPRVCGQAVDLDLLLFQAAPPSDFIESGLRGCLPQRERDGARLVDPRAPTAHDSSRF